jgi:hypothetical protein
MKRTWFQAQIKQDIALSTQFEHERHSTHKRGSYSILYKKKAIHKHIYPKATKSIAIHLMSITSKVINSYLAYHGDQSIWEKHISMTYDTNESMIQRCKHDMIHERKCNMHMYMRCPTQTQKGKRAQSLQAPPKYMH